MADEIYINIGSSFQQPYQGQTPTQAQSAETKQIVKQQPASSQTLYQSPSQTPTTYRVPVNAQTDVDARQPNPFTVRSEREGSLRPQTGQYSHGPPRESKARTRERP